MPKMANDLPDPTTIPEMYQAAILAELQAIRKLLATGPLQANTNLQPADIAGDQNIVLKELAKPAGKRRK
jgi:hypothetical protein